MLSFKPTFSLSCFTFTKRLFSSSSLCHKGGVICMSDFRTSQTHSPRLPMTPLLTSDFGHSHLSSVPPAHRAGSRLGCSVSAKPHHSCLLARLRREVSRDQRLWGRSHPARPRQTFSPPLALGRTTGELFIQVVSLGDWGGPQVYVAAPQFPTAPRTIGKWNCWCPRCGTGASSKLSPVDLMLPKRRTCNSGSEGGGGWRSGT